MSWYEPTRRREAKGGIKAQTKSGTFGKSWWAQRWISSLESLGMDSRLARGRSYARSGQVLSVQIEPGKVSARVQGSRSTPYRVTIGVKTLSEADWRAAAEALAGQAIFAAKLMAGEMPDDIESAFEGVGLSLLPGSAKDLSTDCSCPDWSNPCKHTAAVYYLLGEEFDRDPFLIFRLRGMEREPFIAMLGAQEGVGESFEPEQPGEPLTVEAARFWGCKPMKDVLPGEVNAPPVAAPIPRRLGSLPFWQGEEPLLDALIPSYTAATRRALAVLAGDVEE